MERCGRELPSNTVAYYSATLKKKMLPCETAWADLKGSLLSERSQPEKTNTT